MSALDDQVAIIAGASSGIGYATARLFARVGAKPVVGTSPSTEPEPGVGGFLRFGARRFGCATGDRGKT